MDGHGRRGGPVLLSAAILSIAFLSLMFAGCSAGQTLKKYDLVGQLKKMNEEVENLNIETADLVEIIKVLDEKEGQLAQSLALLDLVDQGASAQVSTTIELSGLLRQNRLKVARVLSLAQQVLAVEQGLKGDTRAELEMAGTTLNLIRELHLNLENFKGINDQINSKLDSALEIMGNM